MPRRLSANLRRRAVTLFDQQLWCWGRDIARPEGNLLVGLGMCRYRAAEPGRDRTAYTGSVAGEGVVWLWGFGLVYCLPDMGGVFLRRSGFDPVLVAEPQRPAHAPEQLGPLVRPTTAQQRATAAELVQATAMWMARYEHWVAETFGIAYREATLAVRDKPPAVSAKEMARTWEHIAKKVFRLEYAASTLRGPWGTLLATLQTPTATTPRPSRCYPLSTQKKYPML